jgi:hypothetical protein
VKGSRRHFSLVAGRQRLKSMDFVDNCYLIHHPQGWLLWDTGVADTIAAMPDGQAPADPRMTHWRRPKTLASQLEQLGVKPADIKYLACRMNYPRAEAARILLIASSHRGMQPDDRTYLIRLLTAMTGVAPPDAERRVDDVTARAKENISRARRSAVILGFMVGAAALIGAVAAWYAACAGGRLRDGRDRLHPLWDWGQPMSWR